MPDSKVTATIDYEAPALRIVGSLHATTLQDKKYGESDGFTFMGDPITNASP